MEKTRAVARDMLGMEVCGGVFLARVLCAPGEHEALCDMSDGDLAHRLQEDCEGCEVIPEVTLVQEQALKLAHRLADLLLLKGCIWLLAPGCELPAEAFPSDRHHRRLQRMAELVVRLEGNNVDAGQATLEAASANLPTLQAASDLNDGAKKVVEAVG